MDAERRAVRVVPVGPADAPTAVLAAVRAALDGSGPALAPVPAGSPASAAVLPPVPDGVALVVATSGSTGVPRHVLLDAAALRTSAGATHDRLAGPGQWVLALPLAHVAGLQVLVRSALAGTVPVTVPGSFAPAPFAAGVAAALARAAGRAVYTSLVPTQLHRLLATVDDDGALPTALAPLRDLDAVLLGGAPAPPALLGAARRAGLRVVTTYGMTETSGGCVYDGAPLDGVAVRLGPEDVVEVSGPVLARGYLDGDDSAFAVDGGVRWFRTRDVGRWSRDRLEVLGRVDDVVVTGGHKVAPAAVEAVLADLPGVGAVCVVGVPDREWGRAVTAVVVPGPDGPPDLATVREAASRTLGPAAAPRHLLDLDALPEVGPGKVDRRAVARWAAARLAGDGDD